MTDIERYELTEPPLARGGMAYVYDAVQVDSGLHLVMKRPMPFEGAAERLDREAATLARLSGPHVMPILDSGVDEAGEPWYVMPRAKHNLSDYLASRPMGLSTGEIVRIAFDQVASGLQTLHGAGLVHRDIKPENILEIDDDESSDGGRWVVSDLGLVRQPLGETTRELTGSASMLGTAAYAAPEMYVHPHDVTSAADVFSLGRLVGSLATGQAAVPGVAILPVGELRRVVQEMTRFDANARPRDAKAAVARAHELLAVADTHPMAEFSAAMSRSGGTLGADDGHWETVLDSLDDVDFILDDVVRVNHASIQQLTRMKPEAAAAIATAMARHLVHGDWGRRNFDAANRHLDWILAVLRSLASSGHIGEFEDVAAQYVLAVKTWHRFSHNNELVIWLRAVDGVEASLLARVIRQEGADEYFAQTFAGQGPFRNSDLSMLLRRR